MYIPPHPRKMTLTLALAASTLALSPAAAQEAPDTTAGIESAKWSDNVTITFSGQENTFRYQSDGLPASGVAEAYLVPKDPANQPFRDNPPESFDTLAGSDIAASPVDTTITTRPVLAAQPTPTGLGQIGVAIDGARIFNDYEDRERQVVALEDNVIHDHAAFLDACNGHPLANGTSYHYHGIPTCVSETIDAAGAHSFMVGVLQDGFPIYADQGAGGTAMTNADLDACGGHVEATPEFPEGIYHYHLTADEAPYSIDCYSGEVEVAARGGPPDFAGVAEQLGISEADLTEALGDGPPDLAAAAERLGIPVEALRAVMPPPPGQ